MKNLPWLLILADVFFFCVRTFWDVNQTQRRSSTRLNRMVVHGRRICESGESDSMSVG